MKKKYIAVFLLFLLFLTEIYAENSTAGRDLLKTGLENYKSGDYGNAILKFRDVVLNPANEKFFDAAYYYIARCYMAQNNYSKAQTNLEFFIQNFPDSTFYSEAVYQKGRLLFLQKDYENAILALYSYIKTYPDKLYVANSYFWIAESLYALGHFKEAKKIYSHIINKYPSSYKVEASKYKLSLIDLQLHKEELLKLLRLSHEEYLKAIDNFRVKEKTYEQAIAGYQRKLLAATNDDTKQLLEELNKEISSKDAQIASLSRQIADLKKNADAKTSEAAVPAEATVAVSSGNNESYDSTVTQLLNLKNEAVDLKLFYINWLSSNTGDK